MATHLSFPAAFQSSIADDPGDLASGLLTPSRYNSGANVSSAVSGQVVYADSVSTLAQSSTFAYSDTASPGGGPLFTVGAGNTTTCGFSLGEISNNLAGIWLTGSGAATTTNYAMSGIDAGGGGVVSWSINGPTGTQWTWKQSGAQKFAIQNVAADSYFDGAAASSIFHFRVDGNNEKLAIYGTAGKGPLITAGTAATDVKALEVTQTWNSTGIAFTGIKYTITDSASSSNSLALQLNSGATELFSVGRLGTIKTNALFVSSLPAASLVGIGSRSFVQDATSTLALNLGVAVIGGGANKIPVYSDGTSWLGG